MTKFLLLFIFFFNSFLSFGQLRSSFKAEIANLTLKQRLIQVGPGPNWNGYPIPDEFETGHQRTLVLGLDNSKKFFVGIGSSFFSFTITTKDPSIKNQNKNGRAIFLDVSYQFLDKKISPMISIRYGGSKVYNDELIKDKTSPKQFLDLGLGVDFKRKNNKGFNIASGVTLTQWISFVPIKMGVQF